MREQKQDLFLPRDRREVRAVKPLPVIVHGFENVSRSPESRSGERPPKGYRQDDQARSKRSRFITLAHAATKSCTNLSCPSELP